MTIAQLDQLRKDLTVKRRSEDLLKRVLDLAYCHLDQKPIDVLNQLIALRGFSPGEVPGFRKGEVDKILSGEWKITKISAKKFSIAFDIPVDAFL